MLTALFSIFKVSPNKHSCFTNDETCVHGAHIQYVEGKTPLDMREEETLMMLSW